MVQHKISGIWLVGKWAALALVPATVACSTVKLAVPADVTSASEALEVKDRSAFSGAMADESFKLGPYAVSEVDRDWDSTSSGSIGPWKGSETQGGYQFKFGGAGKTLNGKCVTAKSAEGASLGGGAELSFEDRQLGCFCSGGDGSSQAVLRNKNGGAYSGQLKTSGGEYEIKEIEDVEGGLKPPGPAGYRVDGDGVVGAVDAMNPGKVWVKKGMDAGEKAELACVFVGLMLYKEPADD